MSIFKDVLFTLSLGYTGEDYDCPFFLIDEVEMPKELLELER